MTSRNWRIAASDKITALGRHRANSNSCRGQPEDGQAHKALDFEERFVSM
jgi:hypothetical protein